MSGMNDLDDIDDVSVDIDYGVVFFRHNRFDTATSWRIMYDVKSTDFRHLEIYLTLRYGKEPRLAMNKETRTLFDCFDYEYWGVECIPENVGPYVLEAEFRWRHLAFPWS